MLQRILFSLILINSVSLTAAEKLSAPMKTVVNLYRDFAWESALDIPDSLAIPFSNQSHQVLSRYLTPSLVSLIIQDRELAAKTNSVGNLDFSPLWDSQDPVGAYVQIRQDSPNTIVVRVNYCQDRTIHELTFHLSPTKQGWRISDIGYGPEIPSLVTLLKSKP